MYVQANGVVQLSGTGQSWVSPALTARSRALHQSLEFAVAAVIELSWQVGRNSEHKNRRKNGKLLAK